MNLIVVAAIVFALAVLMTMTGRGGGNFYVLVLVLAGFLMLLCGVPMRIAVGTASAMVAVTAASCRWTRIPAPRRHRGCQTDRPC